MNRRRRFDHDKYENGYILNMIYNTRDVTISADKLLTTVIRNKINGIKNK